MIVTHFQEHFNINLYSNYSFYNSTLLIHKEYALASAKIFILQFLYKMEFDIGKIVSVYTFNDQSEQNYLDQIFNCEQYQDIESYNNQYCIITFDRKFCFTLNLFLESINSHFINVYDGQLFQIAYLILQHFEQLTKENLYHGNINLENIIIELNQSSQSFTTLPRDVIISDIFFIQYNIQNSSHQSIAKLYKQEDCHNIKTIISKICSLIKSDFIKNYELQFINSKNIQEISIIFNIINNKVILSSNQLFYQDSNFYQQNSKQFELTQSANLLKVIMTEYHTKLKIIAQDIGFNSQYDCQVIQGIHNSYIKCSCYQFKQKIFLIYQSYLLERMKQELIRLIGNQIQKNNYFNYNCLLKQCQEFMQISLNVNKEFLLNCNSLNCEFLQNDQLYKLFRQSNYGFNMISIAHQEIITQIVKCQILEQDYISYDIINQLKSDIINQLKISIDHQIEITNLSEGR